MSRREALGLALVLAACSSEVLPVPTGGGSAEGGAPAQGGGGASGAGGAGGEDLLDCSALDDVCGEGRSIDGRCERVALPDGTACDDGLPCTSGDRCLSGRCVPSAPTECADTAPCQVATCNSATGLCELVAGSDGEPCDDRDVCTSFESCQGGVCGGGELVEIPEEGDPCRKFVCVPFEGLIWAAENQGQECAAPTQCAAFRCEAVQGDGGICAMVIDPSDPPCDDGNPCTLFDSCSGGTCYGGLWADNGTSCSDGVSCTVGDQCVDGSCQSGSVACQPSADACVYRGCPADPVISACVDYPEWGPACEDPSPCRGEGACELGLCKNGPPVNDGAPCDDQRACTTGETCSAGACEGAPVTACASGDGCCPPSCDAGGDGDCGATLYMASTQGLPGFFAFDLEAELWTALPDPPSAPTSRLATRDGAVFVFAEDGNVYGFDPDAGTWSFTMAGPSWMVGSVNPGGERLAALPEGFLLNRGEYLYRSNGGSWMALTEWQGWSAAWARDPLTGDVLIRHGWGFDVRRFELSTNSLWVWADGFGFPLAPTSRFGALSGGVFYTATATVPAEILAIPPGLGAGATLTNLITADPDPSSDLDPATGLIYLGPSDSNAAFEVFDPVSMTLSPLPSPPPIPDGYLSSVVVVRAPSGP